jgi:hypothetical protein
MFVFNTPGPIPGVYKETQSDIHYNNTYQMPLGDGKDLV